ncbi:hypothetical protein KWH02_21135 [Xanthomonas campestris pv. uppalii]|uniref:hypothetical protein n=1 Tax=Xanthomonas TaxID=338 RepID=UPI0009971960|nr:hypothetical protein [Xanthomonas euvesicatoria]MBV6787635.1 hypothetical protein [Xanthomonas campestris pv. uppalii]OOW50462.1 hypothetical protein Xcnt_15240 [Xanthomonas campestris pv. centellae]
MKLLYWLRSSGMWACLVAATVTLLSTVAKSPAMLGIGWVGMIVAGVYAARYSPDAKRAKALQAHAHAQRAKAAGTTP